MELLLVLIVALSFLACFALSQSAIRVASRLWLTLFARKAH
jgi:hypothetical protein